MGTRLLLWNFDVHESLPFEVPMVIVREADSIHLKLSVQTLRSLMNDQARKKRNCRQKLSTKGRLQWQETLD